MYQGTLHIETDMDSAYGTITIDCKDYKFQLLYVAVTDRRGEPQIIKLDKDIPNYNKWISLLTCMLITEKLL
jgi:hypothetical protein